MKILTDLRCAALIGGVLLAGSAAPASASAIVGDWYVTNAGQAQSTVALTLFADGTYVEVQDGSHALDPSGQNGMERGSYTWDPTTNAFQITSVSIDTDLGWGFHDTGPPATPLPFVGIASVAGNSLAFTFPDGSTTFSRVFAASNPIVGGWGFANDPTLGDLTVLTFLPDGHFIEAIDPPTGGYMLYGTFASNPTTGAFSASIIDSTVPGAPFDGFPFDPTSFSSAVVFGDQLIVSSANGQRFALASTSVPEPAGVALFAVGLAGIGFSRRRKPKPGEHRSLATTRTEGLRER